MCKSKKTNQLLEVVKKTINSNLEELMENMSLDLMSNISTELSLGALVDIMLEHDGILDIVFLLKEKAIKEGTTLGIKYSEEIENDVKNKRKKIENIITLRDAIESALDDYCTCPERFLVLDGCNCDYLEKLNKAKEKFWAYIEILEFVDNG